MNVSPRHKLWYLLLLLPLLAACATTGPKLPEPQTPPLFMVVDDGSDAARYAPLFAPLAGARLHNRIGTPKTRVDKNRVKIWVDGDNPSLYHQAIKLTIGERNYTNHVYRVHFERVPFRPRPAYVSTGRNVGLLAIVTVDDKGLPLLLTTVHTCGCYLESFPTEHLWPSAYPEDWPKAADARQRVWGEKPPAHIRFPSEGIAGRPVLHLREDTHRVMDVTAYSPSDPWRPIPTPLAPMEALDHLPLTEHGNTGETSLFYDHGRKKGYVKGAHKRWEFALVSWWTWDAHVGHDKRYAAADELGKRFYTSLKPWNRKKSDIWEFADFLSFWGWDLAHPPK